MRKQYKRLVAITGMVLISTIGANAQCSICTKTASQLGEKPAKALNNGILYLMCTPLAIGGFIGYKWWQREKTIIRQEENQ